MKGSLDYFIFSKHFKSPCKPDQLCESTNHALEALHLVQMNVCGTYCKNVFDFCESSAM
jgi:hypothetical protein